MCSSPFPHFARSSFALARKLTVALSPSLLLSSHLQLVAHAATAPPPLNGGFAGAASSVGIDAHVDVPNPSKLGFAIGAGEGYVTNAEFALQNLQRTLTINRTETECGAAVMTLDQYFKSVYPLASKPAKHCIDGRAPQNSIRFFYDNAPAYLIARVGGQPVNMPKAPRLKPIPYNVTDYDFTPPKLWEPTVLFGNDNCTFYINQYPPSAWWEFEGAAGVPSKSAIEVTHVKVSGLERFGSFNQSSSFNQSLYTGLFWYYAPGSGVYYDVGQTVVGENKLSLLNQLGTSFETMATKVFASGVTFFPGDATKVRR